MTPITTPPISVSSQEIPLNENQVNQASLKFCGFCEKENPKALTCSRCKLMCYCNAECQKTHWKVHKLICLPPECIEIRQSIQEDDQQKVKTTMNRKVWNPDQINAPGAKSPKTIFSNKANKEVIDFSSASRTTSVQYHVEQDAVSFSSHRNNREKKEELLRTGYKGMSTYSETQLSDLIDKQNYIEILKCLWTEKNLDKKIAWLRPLAELGHALLCLELSSVLIEKSQLKTLEDVKESTEFFIKGLIHIDLDASCSDDSSVKAAIGFLLQTYQSHIKPTFDEKELQDFTSKIKKQALLNFKYTTNLPSPKWVTYHGLDIFMGRNSLTPEASWEKKRLESLEKMQMSLA